MQSHVNKAIRRSQTGLDAEAVDQLTVSKLSKSYSGSEQAVNDVSFRAVPGEFLVLLGPSGCGKTTTLRCVAGFERPDSGSISIAGRLAVGPKVYLPSEERGIGMVFQNYGVWPHMTVAENVAFPLRVRRIAKQERIDKVEKMLAAVGLGGLGGRPATQLSGGQQQRVALARALVYDPALLLLDEPLSNLDAALRQSLRFELRRIQESLGVTAIYVTHDQAEAAVLGDRIAIMNGGIIEQIGSPGEIYAEPASGFVADFTGVENLLHARVDMADGRSTRIVTDGGLRLLARLPEPADKWKAGDDVRVAVRAENVEFRTRSPIRETDWQPATIERVEFLGLQTRYLVRAESEELYIRELGTQARLRAGDVIELRLHSDHVAVLAAHG